MLIDKLKTLNKPKIDVIKDGRDNTIKEFWKHFVEPCLPKKDVVIGIYHMLLKYINDPDAVFVIRNYNNTEKGKKNYISLRRGFFTQTNEYSYFFTDNFFAAYFYKLALDEYVPDYHEFKEAMISREFPARFGPCDSKYEKVKAAYSIDGKKGKNPGFADSGYKISHIIDSGMDYLINGKSMNESEWCKLYDITRGEYDDYLPRSDKYGSFYSRVIVNAPKQAIDVLKAHFLRLACPLNYILTPKSGKNRCHTFAPDIKVKNNDVGEMLELQQYAQEQFRKRYGSEYDDYLSKLMLSTQTKIANPGDKYIGISYGMNVKKVGSSSKPAKSKKKSKRRIVFELFNEYIKRYNINSFAEIDSEFPQMTSLVSNIKDSSRFFNDIIKLENGDLIRISNQIADTVSFNKNRKYSNIVKKMESKGITI